MARKTEAEIIAEDRARVLAILESPEGLARPASARKIALVHGLDVENAKSFLRDLPQESAFAAAMDHEGPVNIGASLGGPISRDAKEARRAEIKQAGLAHSLARGFITKEQAIARGLKIED